jgi:predicted Zn-dependent protease
MLLAPDPAAPGRAGEAVDPLQTWVARHPRDAPAWQALASVLVRRRQGQPLRAVRAEAEVQMARWTTRGAVDRFKAART